jgi:hypothetical protein
MNEHRFRSLEIAMIRRGVAPRHARRARIELACHHRELLMQAIARGEDPDQAEQVAHRALGSDALLMERYACQKELRSRAYRWRAAYVLVPLLAFAALSAASMMSLLAVLAHWSGQLHRMSVSSSITHGVDRIAGFFFLWLIPLAAALGSGALANRQRIALRWPLAGILLLSVIVALMNVQLVVTGGPSPGYANAGIGFTPGALPRDLLRAAAMSALALAPVGWLRYRQSSRQLSLE